MKISESPTVQNVFAAELTLIQDDDIRVFVTDAFGLLSPQYFWTIPASVRGHHPPICRTRGGLVHHTKLAVGFADSFIDMWDREIDELQHDQIIAATLLHDMLKRGPTENELETWSDHRIANRIHGRYCADRLAEYHRDQLSRQIWTHGVIQPIIDAVRLHMGRWTLSLTPGEEITLRTNTVVRVTHLADYAASRPLHQYLAERALDPTMRYLRQ